MSESKITFLNKLQERGLADQWGFGFFALVGAVAIFATKYFNAPAIWVALGAIGVMLVYAWLIARYGSGRLRSDQAGDNCYYLGLIYTLASLSYAIFTFDPARTATTIVQGFGIALATTIAGLVLRVLFNQGRPDLEEIESGARRDLVDAVARLKTELGQSVTAMKDFGIHVQQAIAETRDVATRDITLFTETAVSGLKEVMETAKASMQAESSELAARTKRQGAAVDKIVSALEGHGEHLDQLAEAHARIASTLAGISDSGAAARTATDTLAADAQAIASALGAIRESGDVVRSSVDGLARGANDLQALIAAFHAEVSGQLEQMQVAPGVAIANATDALTQSSAAMRGELDGLRSLHESTADALNEQAGTALAALKENNAALTNELSRTREMMDKIQRNVVDMSAELVRQFESRR